MLKLNAEPFLNSLAGLVQDCEEILGLDSSALSGDFEVISTSVKSRGLTVLLVDLPSLCKDLERALDEGVYEPTVGKAFTKKGYPYLFQDIYSKIFTSDWVLSTSVDPEAIRCLRQIFKIFKKYEVACPVSATQEKIHEFKEIEQGLPSPRLSWGGLSLRTCGGYPSLIDLGFHGHEGVDYSAGPSISVSGFCEDPKFYRTLACIQLVADRIVRSWRFRKEWFKPKHGPGAVSERFGTSKYEFPTWPVRLELQFPFAEYGLVNYSLWEDRPWENLGESPCKLIDVPKDFSGPRLIASEPISAQFVQQGIMSVLRKTVHGSLLRHSINFSSQEPSRELALDASLWKDLSTIDLSSASDRMSCALVECVFRSNYGFMDKLNAARTPSILYPDGSVEQLKKFAAQGAAFTFPVQSIVYAIICIGVLYSLSTETSLAKLARQVRVYGDDMIVPTYAFDSICKVLERLHLKVNLKKSFSKGQFRESCGMDAYAGVDVTSASVLTFFSAVDPNSLVSLVECSNNLYKKGFIRASARLLDTIPMGKRKLIPYVSSESTVFGLLGGGKIPLKERYNVLLHRNEVQILTVESKVKRTKPDGRYSLHQWFIEKPPLDAVWQSGEVSSVKARYRLRWVPNYLIRSVY